MVLRCCVCNAEEDTVEDLRVHITVRHLRYIPLECQHCSHLFLPTFSSLTKHYAKAHPSALPVATAIVSYDAEKAAEVDRLVAKSQTNNNAGAELVSPISKPAGKKLAKPNQAKDMKRTQPKKSESKLLPKGPVNEEKTDEQTAQDSLKENKHDLEQLVNAINETAITLNSGRTENELTEGETREQTSEQLEDNGSPEDDTEDAENDKTDANAMAGITLEETINNCSSTTMPPSRLSLPIDNFCKLCRKTVAKIQQHIWGVHVQPRFECSLCDYTTGYASAIGMHMQRKHADNPAGHIDYVEQLQGEFDRKKELAFGEGDVDSSPLGTLLAEEKRRTLGHGGRRSLAVDCKICGKASFRKPKTREKHIWSVHMGMDRYGCRLCPQLRSGRLETIQKHIDQHHPREMEVVTDAKMELFDQYTVIKKKAFPTIPRNTDATEAIKMERFQEKRRPQLCLLCMKMVAGTTKRQHVWGNHVRSPRFGCTRCDYKSAYLGRIKPHMHSKHPESLNDYTDKHTELQGEFKQCMIQAFGTPNAEDSILESPKTAGRKRALIETPGTDGEPTSKVQRQPPGLSSTCALCLKTPFSNEMARSRHLWRKHMPNERFSCRLCPEVRTSSTDYVKVHVERYHGGDMELVLDAKVELNKQYVEMRRQAFKLVGE